jgi:ATP-binding cassette subfamily F protein 3
LDDYRRIILSERDRNGKKSAGTRQATVPRGERGHLRRAAAEQRLELAPLRARIATAEAEISRIHTEIARIDEALAAPELFACDPAKAATLAKARADHAGALARAEEDWLEASALLESAGKRRTGAQ